MPLKKTFADLSAEAKSRIREITADELAQKLQDDQHDWVLIDVRENDEFRAGHLPGARGIGRGILEYHIADEVPDTDTEIVLYCRGGNRSALAADSLQDMGYTNVLSLCGGYREWTQDPQRPVTTEGEPIKH
ncbi:MAG: rhodanese-like domain-containing protein [Armatimonadota bacterium]|nr:rhodanese-like domain-containing protein [Armatimonadota bacterium]